MYSNFYFRHLMKNLLNNWTITKIFFLMNLLHMQHFLQKRKFVRLTPTSDNINVKCHFKIVLYKWHLTLMALLRGVKWTNRLYIHIYVDMYIIVGKSAWTFTIFSVVEQPFSLKFLLASRNHSPRIKVLCYITRVALPPNLTPT